MACHVDVGGIADDSGACSSSVDAFSGDSSLDMVVREISCAGQRTLKK